MFKYDNLTKEAGKQIQNRFIKKANTLKGLAEVKLEELDRLVNNKLNSQQVSQESRTQNAVD